MSRWGGEGNTKGRIKEVENKKFHLGSFRVQEKGESRADECARTSGLEAVGQDAEREH